MKLNDPVKQNTTFRLPFRITTPAGAPINVSTWSFASQLRDFVGNLIFTFTVTFETDGTDGYCVLEATPAETNLWPVGFHNLDVVVTDNLGDIYATRTLQVPVEARVTA